MVTNRSRTGMEESVLSEVPRRLDAWLFLQKHILDVVDEALKQAGVSPQDIGAIAYTKVLSWPSWEVIVSVLLLWYSNRIMHLGNQWTSMFCEQILVLVNNA
eukprot:evm.model.scf_74.10 EVM.evm.TU.scf_74.10   scf_74:70349-70654(-)